jgi:hypothetical protein
MNLFFLALCRKKVHGVAQARGQVLALCLVQVQGMVHVCGIEQVYMGQVHGKNWVHGNHEV